MKRLQELQLLSPKDFKGMFAPHLSESTIRDLFNVKGFPSVKLGTRIYTTAEAAARWLAVCGIEGLMTEEGA
jgi:hypothetical protein